MNSKLWRWSVIFILTVAAFQNCTPNGFKIKDNEELGIFKNSECLSNTNFDACVWNKNASANVANFNGNLTDYSNSQTMGVRFSKLGTSDILKNSEVDVTTISGSRVKRDNGQVRFLIPFDEASPSHFLQVNTYYWSEKTLALFEQNLGASPLAQKSVKVLVDSPLSGWSPAFNEVHLQARSNERKYMALDGGLIAYNISQAAISILNQQQELAAHTTVGNCRSVSGSFFIGQCCVSQNGCIEAIASGQADFIVALLFPQKPALGEDWAASQSGIKNCGITRDPSANSGLSANQAYNACQERMVSGFAPVLGAVYASFWYQLTQKAPQKEMAIKLFFKHISLMKADDTFITALTKIRTLDQELNQGSLTALIEEIAQQKGFN